MNCYPHDERAGEPRSHVRRLLTSETLVEKSVQQGTDKEEEPGYLQGLQTRPPKATGFWGDLGKLPVALSGAVKHRWPGFHLQT